VWHPERQRARPARRTPRRLTTPPPIRLPRRAMRAARAARAGGGGALRPSASADRSPAREDSGRARPRCYLASHGAMPTSRSRPCSGAPSAPVARLALADGVTPARAGVLARAGRRGAVRRARARARPRAPRAARPPGGRGVRARGRGAVLRVVLPRGAGGRRRGRRDPPLHGPGLGRARLLDLARRAHHAAHPRRPRAHARRRRARLGGERCGRGTGGAPRGAALGWGLLAGLAYASYYLFGKRYFARYDPPTIYMYALLLARWRSRRR
jgi:hypothetical protein